MIKILLLAQFLSLSVFSQNPRTLLAIFAHPDDEQSISPILAKYADEGVQVYLAVVTDGRFGVTDFAKIPSGDTLVAVRQIELNCASDRLKINSPIYLNFPDKLFIDEGYEKYVQTIDNVGKKIIDLLNKIQPEVVVTWPPWGWSGHHDHRV